jgi:signal transduction histidine kinase
VIIEESDNVQLRALFALLGSSQTGPLLVQPLLGDRGAIGAIVVGNGRSRRPFGPNEVKLCQALARQVVTAIQNTRRYRMAQDRIAEMITAQNKTRRASLQARAEIQELSDRLAGTRAEIEALRQARDALEIKLVGSRAETDTLSRRLAALENDPTRRQAGGARLMQAGLPDTPMGIIVTDAKGLILATNSVAEGYLGRKRDELQRLDLRAISDEPQWLEAVAAAAEGESVQFTLPLGTRTLVGGVAPLSGPGADEGQVEGLAVILQDFLAQTQQTQPESVAAMLEDLQNPMTTIIGYVDLLLSEAMGSVGEAQRKFLRRIKSSAEQVVQTIRDREVGYGTEPGPADDDEGRPAFLARRTVQVEKLLARTVAESRAQFEDKNLKLELELDDALPAVEADPDHLERVLSCLLSNACLASPEGGRIEVQATWSRAEDLPIELRLFDEDSEGFVNVSVKDFGGGLSEDAPNQIFEQTRPSQSPPGLGESGAALAQAKALVEAHGGCLWMETEEGVGTTFGIALPLDGPGDRPLMNRSLGERDVVIVG